MRRSGSGIGALQHIGSNTVSERTRLQRGIGVGVKGVAGSDALVAQ